MTNSKIEITRAFAISETNLLLAAINSEWEAYEPKSLIVQYKHGESDPWMKAKLDIHTQSICVFIPDSNNPEFSYYVIMSANGEICHYHPDGPFDEYIFGAEESYDESKDVGRLLSIRQIGSKLYACGRAGQIYVRHDKNDWKHLTKDLLWSKDGHNNSLNKALESSDGMEADDDEWMEKWWDSQQKKNARIILQDINGPSEDKIYICGDKGRLYFWNGEELEDLDPGVDHMLNTIHISDNNKLWVCGLNGQILRGTEEEGFEDFSTIGKTELLSSITTYKGKRLFASQSNAFGLFEFDEDSEELKRITPRLKPALRSIHTIQAVGDVLWLIGSRDILRYDGETWERIQHPDIPVSQL